MPSCYQVNAITTQLSTQHTEMRIFSRIINLYETCLQIIRVYGQSVPSIHGHNGLWMQRHWLIAESKVD